MQAITLHFSQGGSDKIYQASIIDNTDGYVVNFAYGRRGSTLRTGTKTQKPVELEKAEKIYNKIVKEKMAKGYTPDELGRVNVNTDKQDKNSGVHCQLLNPINETEALAFCADNAYCLQEKKDGVRQLLQRSDDTVHGINRRGLYVGLAKTVAECASKLHMNKFMIDSEGMGEYNHVFDALEFDGKDLRQEPYKIRYDILSTLLFSADRSLRIVPTAFSRKDKLAMLKKYREEGREGVVFKRIDAPYTAGRPNSGGTQFKFKFYETCSVVVEAINDKRSIQVGFIENRKPVLAGNVTIPTNHEIPQVGDVCEIRYLYAMPKSNALYQPVYLGKRTDIMPIECTMLQLKYKVAEV